MTARADGATLDVLFYAPAITGLLVADTRLTAGGAETQVQLLTRVLARTGMSVGVVAFDHPDLPSSDAGVRVVRRPRYFGRRGWRGRLREMTAILAVLQRARARTVVVRAAGPAAFIVGVFTRLWGARFIYAASSDFDFGLAESRRLPRKLGRGAVRLAHHVVVQNRVQAEHARALAPRASVSIARSLAESADEVVGVPTCFVWIGRAVSFKRPLLFVDLARELPHVEFAMVLVPVPSGSGDDMSRDVQIAALDVANLRVLPPMSRSEVRRVIRSAIAIVNTSEFEGMPNTFLEGWALGVPALSFSHDPDDVIKRFALGYSAEGDWESFVDRAGALWDSRQCRYDLAARCRGYIVHQHSEDAVLRAWLPVLTVMQSSVAPERMGVG